MAKTKSVYFCNNCGAESPKWIGRCPVCGEWNTYVEEVVSTKSAAGGRGEFGTMEQSKVRPQRIDDIQITEESRIDLGNGELNRVLGGGLVRGSLVLIGGEPGIGKSTLILQTVLALKGQKILYVSGEESARQLKLRAERIGGNAPDCYIVCETSLGDIFVHIRNVDPDIVVIDSIQTIYDEEIASAPGSVSQVREVTGRLMRIAKGLNISIFIIGHVTKDGGIAGPRVLEHMVDTVLYFEGERHQVYRILRCVKNRFGSTNEIGVFEMREDGLAEVKNPSAAMLEGRPADASGTSVVCTLEGTRPMLLEVQALVSGTTLANPRRMTAGLDYNRVSLLLAVLEKRAGYKLGECDVYVNVVGGMRIYETAADAAVAAALMSSYRNKMIPHDTVLFGEVGLTGEIRSVSQADKRVSEAFRMGFRRCILPRGNEDGIRKLLESGLYEGCCAEYISGINDLNRLFARPADG